ncbi:hypothetical protein NTHI1209_01631 [Haemophilus influenzae]|uniref:Uncharacterized protein n=1 Tax=Haemophilus influenzae TaxID=727 RepID=A0A158SUL0_HAEIF|nr:hypothetical protein NTHI1209_00154 [Haemophilus influenzae]KIS36004.1 hypothetical protein NTHI1209_01631 [Haemophilus influenzae]
MFILVLQQRYYFLNKIVKNNHKKCARRDLAHFSLKL